MKIHKELYDRWEAYAEMYLAEKGLRRESIKNPKQAWLVAYRLDFEREAHHIDRTIKRSHIETALRRIFPNTWRKNENSQRN